MMFDCRSGMYRLICASTVLSVGALLTGCDRAESRPAAAATSSIPQGVPAARSALSAADRALPSGVETAENAIGMTLVLIPAGEFWMGSSDSDPEALEDEKPRHLVPAVEPFYLGIAEVTVGQFRQFVDETGYVTEAERNGSGYAFDSSLKRLLPHARASWRWTGFPQGDDHPVVNVCWDDAVAFCDWLSRKEGMVYRLPTEAEWEYACRAGAETIWSFGDDVTSLEGTANICDVQLRAAYPFATWSVDWDDEYAFTAPVGSYRPNAFGLYDMHGNVFEWCQDLWPEETYDGKPLVDSTEPPAQGSRIIRGGSYLSLTLFTRSADRVGLVPSQGNCIVGFRVARAVPSAPSE